LIFLTDFWKGGKPSWGRVRGEIGVKQRGDQNKKNEK